MNTEHLLRWAKHVRFASALPGSRVNACTERPEVREIVRYDIS